MNPFTLHLLFDLFALGIAAAVGYGIYRYRFPTQYKHPAFAGYTHYLITLSFGSLLGATLLGTLNLWVSGVPGIGRSILGAILGAIAAVEWYKARHRIEGSTGAALVVPLGVGVAIGRIGCFVVGLTDYTYGTPTSLPWAWDFGDGVLRHPVQLYESLSLVLAVIVFLIVLKLRPQRAVNEGFYWFMGWYSVQRFAFEFIKPYSNVVASLNVFHLGSIVLVLYAVFMINRARRARA